MSYFIVRLPWLHWSVGSMYSWYPSKLATCGLPPLRAQEIASNQRFMKRIYTQNASQCFPFLDLFENKKNSILTGLGSFPNSFSDSSSCTDRWVPCIVGTLQNWQLLGSPLCGPKKLLQMKDSWQDFIQKMRAIVFLFWISESNTLTGLGYFHTISYFQIPLVAVTSGFHVYFVYPSKIGNLWAPPFVGPRNCFKSKIHEENLYQNNASHCFPLLKSVFL